MGGACQHATPPTKEQWNRGGQNEGHDGDVCVLVVGAVLAQDHSAGNSALPQQRENRDLENRVGVVVRVVLLLCLTQECFLCDERTFGNQTGTTFFPCLSFL